MSPRRVLVTGGGGLVGSAVCRSAPAGTEVIATVRSSPAPATAESFAVELSDGDAVGELFSAVSPDLVIHTAYSRDLGRDVEQATANVAFACGERGVGLVHMSTDVVFDGEHAPYDEDSLPAPISDYGRSKLAAEESVSVAVPDAAIVRTSLVVHPAGTDSTSEWMLRDLRAGKPVTLFHDEFRCPILVGDLAKMLWSLADLDAESRAGVWHLVGPERLSRVDVGRLWCDALDLDRGLIEEASSADLAEPRPRDLTLVSARAASLSVEPQPIGSVIGHGSAI